MNHEDKKKELEKKRDKLAKLEEQIIQLRRKKQMEEQKLREEERKARTKKLIEIGGHFEKMFGQFPTSNEAIKYLEYIKELEKKWGNQDER